MTTSPVVKIFGREPVVIVTLIEATLVFLSLVAFHLSTDQVTGLMGVVTAALGIYVAIVTRQTVLGVTVGLIKATVICVAGFGLNLDPQTVASFIVLVTAVFGLWQRTQTTPLAPPTPEELPAAADGTPSVTTLREI